MGQIQIRLQHVTITRVVLPTKSVNYIIQEFAKPRPLQWPTFKFQQFIEDLSRLNTCAVRAQGNLQKAHTVNLDRLAIHKRTTPHTEK